MSHNDHNHGGGFSQGLFLGILVGVGIAIFLRTKEGQRLKRQVLDTSEDVIDDFGERMIEFLEYKDVEKR